MDTCTILIAPRPAYRIQVQATSITAGCTEAPIYYRWTSCLVLTVRNDARIIATISSKNNDNSYDNHNTNGRPIRLMNKKLTDLVLQAGWTQTETMGIE